MIRKNFRLLIKTGLLMVSIVCNFSVSADSYDKPNSYFNHLSEINSEWCHHKNACPDGDVSFSSDLDRIQLHLYLVIDYLESNIPEDLNSVQRSKRLHLLGGLQQYADEKVFPVNRFHANRQPYFVDYLGTHCAVGQMIHLSGNQQLVSMIKENYNYDFIEDISTEGLAEWATEFGFTVNELQWIQPAYLPKATMEQVLGGTNGKLNKIEYDYFTESFTIAGEFTELDNLPCLNVGMYLEGQLSCLGSGVDGIIHDVVHESGIIYIFGELHYDGEIFACARYDGSSWNYLDIPDRAGAISTAANVGGFGYLFEVSISHSSVPGHQEVWHLLNDGTWEKKAKVKGVILDIIASSYGRVHVGHMDSVVVFNPSGDLDTSLIVNNVLLNSRFPDRWYGIDDNVSDTVNVVVNVGGALIFGGTCSNQMDLNTICISRYFYSTLQPLYLNDYGNDSYSINTIAYYSGNKFVFGGDFEYAQGIGTYGSNLATFDLVYNTIEPLAVFDKEVNSLSYLGGELFIGGSFQTNLDDQPINFLASQKSSVGIGDFSPREIVEVYPNPFTNLIYINDIQDGVDFSIYDSSGRKYKSGQVVDETITGLDLLPHGTYLLRLESRDDITVKKIIK